ncbi:MAG: type IV pilus biogenesis/stability protein PilW [Gammaproteobacteria bacterium]|jgi:type IV pilus assembly protein PilF
MKLQILFLIFTILIAGCSSSANNSTLRPRESTNQIAITNLNLAIEYMRSGSMEIALEKLNRAYQADPQYYGTHNAYGLLYQRLGDPTLAEQHFKKAIELNINDSSGKNNYGSFLCLEGRYSEAEDIFLSAAANPLYLTPEVAYANAGTCAVENNRIETAEKHFRQALTINPEIASALLQMSNINFEQKNYLSARGYLQRFQAVTNHSSSSLLLGIKIETELGDRNTVSSYEMLLKNNYPDSTEIQELNKITKP